MNDVYRALSDPTRRRILALLRGGDMGAGDIAARFEQAWPTISGHLAVLRDANLVHADRRGTAITYHLNVSVLEEAMMALMQAFGIGAGTTNGRAPGEKTPAEQDPGKPS
jgi:ArsR family transcriptional regulator, repressor of sdpIR and other operons